VAHAGVADAYVYLGDQGMVPPVEAGEKARRSLNRALELDPDLVDAHVTLAWMNMLYDWNWPGAEHHFLKALAVGPSSADAHSRYGCYLAWIPRRFDEAVAFARKGVELAPIDEVASTWLGCVLWTIRRPTEAVEELRRAIELNHSSFHARYHLGVALRLDGEPAAAIEQFETAMELGGRHPWALGEMGQAYLALGDEAQAEACHTELVARSGEFTARVHLAVLSAALGRTDLAFQYLEEAYQLRDVFMAVLKWPTMNLLRSDPRFDDLVRRVGLP
jgi:tetratricopeptide (TPR) repeat protein